MISRLAHRLATGSIALLALVLILLSAAFATESTYRSALAATGQAIIQGTTETSTISGRAKLQDTETGLLIQVELEAPPGEHGFHIHEFGSCAEAGSAAGGHYNPEGVKHGYLPRDGFANAHAGDLGNITATNTGKATYSALLLGLNLTQGDHPIAGRALIVHEKPDDFGQPTGNAGERPGCGTIVLTAGS